MIISIITKNIIKKHDPKYNFKKEIIDIENKYKEIFSKKKLYSLKTKNLKLLKSK